MFSVWMVPPVIGFLLDILVIVYLVRGPLKRFIFVFFYCVVEAAALAVSWLSHLGVGPPFESVFWTADIVTHGLITLLLLSLIRESLGSSVDLKRLASWVLPLVVLGVALGSALTFKDANITVWMTPVSRNLSFCEEIFNFMLWTALIRKRDYDSLLLFISAGIGIQVTGEVIGHTIRTFIQMRTMMWLPDSLITTSELICLFTWAWAFYSAKRADQRNAAAAVAGGPLAPP